MTQGMGTKQHTEKAGISTATTAVAFDLNAKNSQKTVRQGQRDSTNKKQTNPCKAKN